MQTWTHDERDIRQPDFPEGPWSDEPDKMQWVDEATDLDCLIVRGPAGALCGYVGVPAGHLYYKVDYDQISVDVHGGLSFSDKCDENATEGHGICHIPLPGRTDDIWWFGFDCAHAFDYAPEMTQRLPEDLRGGALTEGTYRTVPYVRAECAKLAQQLAEVTVEVQ